MDAVDVRPPGAGSDHIRGRIFGFDYMLITLSLSVSALIASAVADQIGAPDTVTILGGVALVWALVWFVLSRGVRGTGLDGSTEPEPDGGSNRSPRSADHDRCGGAVCATIATLGGMSDMRRNIRFALPLAVAISIVGTTVHAGTPAKVIDTTGYEFGSASGELDRLVKGVSYRRGDRPVREAHRPARRRRRGGSISRRATSRSRDQPATSWCSTSNPGSETRRSASATSRPSSSVLLPPGSTPRRTTTSRRSPGATCCSARTEPRLVHEPCSLYDFALMDLTTVASAPTGSTATADSIRGDFATSRSAPDRPLQRLPAPDLDRRKRRCRTLIGRPTGHPCWRTGRCTTCKVRPGAGSTRGSCVPGWVGSQPPLVPERDGDRGPRRRHRTRPPSCTSRACGVADCRGSGRSPADLGRLIGTIRRRRRHARRRRRRRGGRRLRRAPERHTWGAGLEAHRTPSSPRSASSTSKNSSSSKWNRFATTFDGTDCTRWL